MKNLLTALAIGLGAIAPAHADFVINGGSAPAVLGNDFKTTLDNHGLTSFVAGISGLSVSGDGIVTLYAFANESFLHTAFERDGVQKVAETNTSGLNFFDPAGDHFPGTLIDSFLVAANDAFCNACAHNFRFVATNAAGFDAGVGDAGFGIYYNPSDLSTIALAFDDGLPSDDDNHDDLIVIARFTVPEPSTWGLMIAAFGALALMRRRHRARA